MSKGPGHSDMDDRSAMNTGPQILYTVSCGYNMEGGVPAYEDFPRICFSESEARDLAEFLVDDFDVVSIVKHRFDRDGWAGSSSVERVKPSD